MLKVYFCNSRRFFLIRDLELKRMEIVSDLEVKNKVKWKAVHEEIDRYKSLYFEVRNDFELYKAEAANCKKNHEQILEERTLLFEGQKKKLSSEIVALNNQLASTLETEKLRQTQRANNELTARANFQKREIEDLRAQKERLVVNHEQELRLLNRKVNELNAICKTVEVEKATLLTQTRNLEEELRKSVLAGDHLSEQQNVLQNELASLQSRHEEAAHRYNVDISDLKLAAVKLQADADSKLSEAKQKQAELAAQLKGLQEELNQQRLKHANAEKTHQKELAEASGEAFSRAELLESEKNQLEQTIATLQQRISEMQVHLDSKLKEFVSEETRSVKELSRLEKELESLSREHQQTISELERQRSANASLQDTVTKLRHKISDQKDKLDQQNTVLQTQSDELLIFEQKAAAAATELASLQAKFEFQQHESISQAQQLESQLNILLKDKEDLRQQLRAGAEKVDLLEQRCSQLKQKHGNLKLAMSNTQLEATTAKKQLDVERAQAASQLKEFRRRQDNFMQLLQSEVLQKLPSTA